MKKITRTYYVCQYCGYEDTDSDSLRAHEKVCKKRITLEDTLLGRWVKMGNSAYFLVKEIRPFGRVEGIKMTVQSISQCTYDAREIANKEIDEKGPAELWEKWIADVSLTKS